MNTAMNASRKIKIPPAMGKTMGMRGTIDSITSGSLESCVEVVFWFDIVAALNLKTYPSILGFSGKKFNFFKFNWNYSTDLTAP